jgi:TolB-like protein/Flp pilus assembly protein TadD/DNA-binding winged helix-turn-helix (wHTH) protein
MAPGMENTQAATGPESAGFQVGDLIIDPGQRRVTRDGTDIPLPHLSFELLMALARSAPDLVSFEQLTARVWPGLVITPETISQRVKLVRDALGDDPQSPRYIAGVRGSGYRMVASVRPLKDRRRALSPAAPEPLPQPYWVKSEGDGAAADTAAVGSGVGAGTAAATSASREPRARGMVGGILVIAALVAVPWAITHYLRAPQPSAGAASQEVVVQPPRTIAVLPLVDLSPAGGNAYLGDGLAQELSTRLMRIRGLRVAARTSAFAFRDRNADVRTIAQTLGVRHILEGSVLREGDHLRVTAQLVDSSSGYAVWSQTYDRTWQDLLAIEDDLARSIIGTLQVVLTSDLAQRVTQAPTTHLDAFDRYLTGLAKLRGPADAAQLEQAEDSFHQALAADPQFALAYAGLCERYSMGYDQTRDAAFVVKAEAACGQALKLDDSLREVSAALGHLYLVSGRNAQAEAIYRAALRSDPNDADGYTGLGAALDGQHRSADAERAMRQAVDVEPSYWGAHQALGNFLFRHGRYVAAVPTYRRVAELVPASPAAFNNLGAALEMSGDFSGAAAAFERSLALEPTRSAYSNLGTVYYFLARYTDAGSMFARATQLAQADHRVWGNLADALWQIEARRAEAREAYQRAIELARRSLEVNAQDALTWMQLAFYSSRAGDGEHARQYAARARALGPDDIYVHYYAALIALEQHDAAGALAALDQALRGGFPAQMLRAAPDFNSLRDDPRFRQLLAQADKPPTG